MTAIPDFKTPDDQEAYLKIFDDQLIARHFLFTKVLAQYFPHKDITSFSGEVLEVLNDMTSSLIYATDDEFRDKHPEYKTERDDFFSGLTVREAVREAFAEQRATE